MVDLFNQDDEFAKFTDEQIKAEYEKRFCKTKKTNRTEEEFDKIWNMYDKKGSRSLSLKKWMKLSDEDARKCFICVPKYTKYDKRKYWKDLQAFINQKVWETRVYSNITGLLLYDPDEAAEAVNLDIEPRGATSYPKGPDGIYITHNDHPVYGVIFDGYNDNNRPAGTKIRYCGLVYVWNPKIATFEQEKK